MSLPKGDPFRLTSPARPVFEREFTTPAAPGEVFGWQVRRMDNLTAMRAMELGRRYAERFVHAAEPEALPPVNGQEVAASESACYLVAALETAQCGAPETRYSAFEVFAQMTDGALFEALAALHEAIQPEEAPAGPLAPSAPSTSTVSSGG